MENLEIYRKMSEPPKSALKTIVGGKLKGMTDINPQWRYKVMTENFGIVGIGWKYTIDKTWLETAANGEIIANAQVSVFVKHDGEWSDPIVGVGGSKLVAREREGLASNDEAYKMAVTDAFSTSLKMLGVAAAIYEGRWDGSKYSASVESVPQNNQRPSAYSKAKAPQQQELVQVDFNKKSAQAPAPTPSPAADSPELKEAIQTVNDYIQKGMLNKSWIPTATQYINTKDLDGLKRVIDYMNKKIDEEVTKELEETA